jgi:hypothetical protein
MFRNSTFIGGADVHLQTQKAAKGAVLRVIVDHDAGDGAVQNLDDRVSTRDDDQLIPVVRLDDRLQLVGAPLQRADYFWAAASGTYTAWPRMARNPRPRSS